MSIKQDHNDLVKNLAKPGQALRETFSDDAAHAIHMTLGLVGEAIETKTHIDHPAKETREEWAEELVLELGDVMFYAVGLMHYFDITLEELIKKMLDNPPPSLHSALQKEADEVGHDCTPEDLAPDHLVRTAGSITEIMKKHWAYDKAIVTESMYHPLYNVMVLVEILSLKYYGAGVDEVLKLNIEKLTKRYEKGHFSNEQAVKRVDQNDVRPCSKNKIN